MTDLQLFEVAAKLHNLSLKNLTFKKRYLDAVIVGLPTGERVTHYVADLELIALGDAAAIANALDDEAAAAVSQSKKPQHTRKR